MRFVHAVPGVGEAILDADGIAVGAAGFGEATAVQDVPAGPAKLVLRAGGTPVRSQVDLQPGRNYTVVAMLTGETATLKTFTDGTARASEARLRVIHAAPELGNPDLWVGSTEVAKEAAFTTATKYVDLSPGSYRVIATAPGDKKDVVVSTEAPAPAGSASTALVVGSRGEQAKFVLLSDDTTGPQVAPEAGFGGLTAAGADAGPPWLAALLAALIAGALGAALHRSVVRSRSSGSPGSA